MFRIDFKSRAFQVNYVMLRASDAGGPCASLPRSACLTLIDAGLTDRDAIEKMCHELMSNELPLFGPCPNGESASPASS